MYNFNNQNAYFNISAFNFSEHGAEFDPSVSVMVFPERTTNLVRGKGFHDNDYVLQQFVDAGKYQEALDYFGFEGRYVDKDGVSSYNRNEGCIIYRNYSFDSYSELLYSYIKEMHHKKMFSQGTNRMGNSGIFDDDRWPEEREGAIRQYKMQGLHRNKANSTTFHSPLFTT